MDDSRADGLAPATEAGPPLVEPDRVTFRYADPTGAADDVVVVQEVAEPRYGPVLQRSADGIFEGVFRRPPVDRFEYRFDVVSGESHDTILDPANPLRAPGAFGERSVVEFPEYTAPSWLGAEAEEGAVVELDVPSAVLGDVQPTMIWSAAGTGPETPLPLLVALDGVEFARFSGLVHFLDVQVASGALPPMRAVLCQPTDRGEHYSASPQFADYLADELPAAVAALVAVTAGRPWRLGLGASLGGVALLHAHRLRPASFDSLFLQSSSFFHPEDHPGSQPPLERIQRFVESLDGDGAPEPIPVVMTCGTVERNLANNQQCAATLASQGYPATLHVVRDAHNWVAWRDAWTPSLVTLLQEVSS